MNVTATVVVDDEARRAIAVRYGNDRLATREEVRSWAESELDATLEMIVDDYRRNEGAE